PPSTSPRPPPATRPSPLPRGRSLVSTAFASLFIVAQSRIYHGETRPVCLTPGRAASSPSPTHAPPPHSLRRGEHRGRRRWLAHRHPASDGAPRPRALCARPRTARAEEHRRQRRAGPHPAAAPPPGLRPGAEPARPRGPARARPHRAGEADARVRPALPARGPGARLSRERAPREHRRGAGGEALRLARRLPR